MYHCVSSKGGRVHKRFSKKEELRFFDLFGFLILFERVDECTQGRREEKGKVKVDKHKTKNGD